MSLVSIPLCSEISDLDYLPQDWVNQRLLPERFLSKSPNPIQSYDYNQDFNNQIHEVIKFINNDNNNDIGNDIQRKQPNMKWEQKSETPANNTSSTSITSNYTSISRYHDNYVSKTVPLHNNTSFNLSTGSQINSSTPISSPALSPELLPLKLSYHNEITSKKFMLPNDSSNTLATAQDLNNRTYSKDAFLFPNNNLFPSPNSHLKLVQNDISDSKLNSNFFKSVKQASGYNSNATCSNHLSNDIGNPLARQPYNNVSLDNCITQPLSSNAKSFVITPLSLSAPKPKTPQNPVTKKKKERICYNCKVDNSVLWRHQQEHLVCNPCGLYYKKYNKTRPICWKRARARSCKKEKTNLKISTKTIKEER